MTTKHCTLYDVYGIIIIEDMLLMEVQTLCMKLFTTTK